MSKLHVFKHMMACEFCGELTSKRGPKQKWCKKCVPNMQAARRAGRYSLSQPMFEKMLNEQMCLCVFCKTQLHNDHINGLHVDHNHLTNRARGLLCGECNHGIGHTESIIARGDLEKVISYIRKTK